MIKKLHETSASLMPSFYEIASFLKRKFDSYSGDIISNSIKNGEQYSRIKRGDDSLPSISEIYDSFKSAFGNFAANTIMQSITKGKPYKYLSMCLEDKDTADRKFVLSELEKELNSYGLEDADRISFVVDEFCEENGIDLSDKDRLFVIDKLNDYANF